MALEGSQHSLSHREPRIARVPLPTGNRKGGGPAGNRVPATDPPLPESPAPTWLPVPAGCAVRQHQPSTRGMWRMCQVMEVPCGKGKGGNSGWGSFQEPYPKGVIPLSVIEMARSTKDNKFQVITSHRIFVFRAENEGE